MNIDDIMHPAPAPTAAQKRAALELVLTIAEAIRTLGCVPSGELYAQVMGTLSLDAYQRIVQTLKRAGVVSEVAHELRWIGPTLSPTKQS